MHDQELLDYGVERTPRRSFRRVSLFVLAVTFGAFAWGLHVLEHAPYRPPMDMSTLLAGPDLALVRVLKYACIFVAGVAAVGLLRLRS